MSTTDVLIIGAGLAGLRCAVLLSRAGLDVTLVDRKPTPSVRVHTTGIFVRKTFEDFSLPEDCLGDPVRHVQLVSPSGHCIPLESPHAEFRVGRMGVLYERWLEEAIRLGCRWVGGTRLLGLRSIDSRTVGVLQTGRHRHTVSARFVIGADGARTRVARDLGLDVNHRFLVGVEDVAVGIPLDGPPRFDCVLDPTIAPGYLAWVVHDGEEAHIGVAGEGKRYDPAAALATFKKSLAKRWDLSRMEVVERRGGIIPVNGILRRIVSPRGLLVGDAAGAVSPLTAGGLDPAIRLSTLAARVTRQYLESGDPQSLAAYDGNRFRPRFASRLLMRNVLSAISRRWVIDAGFMAMSRWPMRSLAWHIFFGRGSFPDVETFSPEQEAWLRTV